MFKKFCASNNLFTKNASTSTHLFMDGGILSVPNDKLVLFYHQYIQYINQGEQISLIEKLGHNCTMRFFLDIDNTNNIDDILTAANNIMKITTPYIYTSSDSNGFHIIYNVQFTCDECISTCKQIIDMLPIHRKHCIDISVYKTGIRMIYSDKFTNGSWQNRWYIPIKSSISDKLTLDDFRHSIVRIFTINTSLSSTSNSLTFHSDILKYLTKIHPKYSEISSIKIKSFNNGIKCLSVDSKFCTNINDEHKNNHVYFVINSHNELYQKCFSHNYKISGRIHCYCHQYKSKPIQLPKLLDVHSS
uniref:C962R-like N-terminal AEP domain-containing protein n=1 Tax=viral metagenome TaxID=1070528 RepID=A0A6C0F734_9ZZZZ|tara:strand:+ start:19263 stop:20171 length:909 start_codon:yes stop_codon:yes gene_type:complete